MVDADADISVLGLSVDCADAAKLADFWARALGGTVSGGPTTENAAIQTPAGLRVAFHRVPEPKTVKNRLHLDLISGQFAAESERLRSLGATPLRDIDKGTARWTTFADPEGNEFDLVAG